MLAQAVLLCIVACFGVYEMAKALNNSEGSPTTTSKVLPPDGLAEPPAEPEGR